MSEVMEASLTAKIINPVLEATIETFDIMLGCAVTRKELNLKTRETPFHDITAVIGLSGTTNGTICLSLPKETAFEAVFRMLEMRPEEIDELVCDAVGEFSNVVGGTAKDKIKDPDMHLGLPNVIYGENHHVEFPTQAHPMYVKYDSDIGPFMVLFGFVAS